MLCDIRLPKKNGHQVLKAIKGKNKDVPVIAQTAYAMPEEKKKILKNGFDGYIDKPVNSAKIYGIINKLMDK
jgi:CheY-like chemotaxis protein